ncbi:hypothetical protein [Aliivibrio fischeri]|uniref:hypothetical protein n=1 Tax=Aliivibrio fischeri TaxID=668 RepID=UPI0007C4EE97|nr:hypothetical protein [Aliivibrio fischeri]
MTLIDWNPPPCPECKSNSMIHKFYNVSNKDNGWYCEECGAGKYDLGNKKEALKKVNIEALTARFAITLLNS